MAEKYISIVGVGHYFRADTFKVGQKIILRKDLDNKYDDEAIQAELDTIGKVAMWLTIIRQSQKEHVVQAEFMIR